MTRCPGLWAIGALVAWLRARASASLTDDLRRGGDALAALLFVVGAVTLGANTVQADNSLWYGPLFFVSEGCIRLGALANRNETEYFLSVANQVATHGCSAP